MPFMLSVVFVCLGNICRSPTAEGIFIELVNQNGLSKQVIVDSAGTGGWHIGDLADPRSRAEASRRGIQLRSRSRQFRSEDFQKFDLIIAMDRANLRNILRLARTDEERSRVHLLRKFDPLAPPDSDVPDPYYGGTNGFPDVFDICARGCEGLMDEVRKRLSN
jgi:protein-tyrosine phosphatase